VDEQQSGPPAIIIIIHLISIGSSHERVVVLISKQHADLA
jgi:hypothetical protein